MPDTTRPSQRLPFDADGLSLRPQAESLIQLLELAEPLAARHFRQPLQVAIKADDSPVTQADRAIEAAMRAHLADHHGQDGIYGEEEGQTGSTDRLWVIDPIDGTQAFMHGNPLYGHLVAWLRDGRPVLGGIGLSALGEMMIAASGGGCWYGRPGAWRQVRTRPTTLLAQAALLSTSPDMFGADDAARFARLAGACRYRRYGGDCFNYVAVAAGWADLVAESQLKAYDFLAAVPLLTEAGGVISDWQGRPLTLSSGPRALAAATPALHRAALAALADP